MFHRDLKPDNILVRQLPEQMDRWEVRLIDFGLAVRQQTAGKSVLCPPDARSASDRSYAGTFKYAPPEQKNEPDPISGKIEPVGPYSDVYTFGKTFCEALFGTTAPQSFHYARLPEPFRPLQQLLEIRCIVDAVSERIADFGDVLAKLDALDPRQWEEQRQANEQRQAQNWNKSDGRRRKPSSEKNRKKLADWPNWNASNVSKRRSSSNEETRKKAVKVKKWHSKKSGDVGRKLSEGN